MRSTLATKGIIRFQPEILLLIQASLLLSTIVVGLSFRLFNIDRQIVVYVVSFEIVIWFFWSVWSWGTISHQFLDPYILFLISAMLFNGGQAIIELFGMKTPEIFDVYLRVNSKTVLNALILVSLGLQSFHLGGLMGAISAKGGSNQSLSNSLKYVAREQNALRLVGWFLLLISFFPAITRLRDTVQAVMSGSYWAVFQIDVATGLDATPRVLALFLVPGALFLLAGSKRKILPLIVSGLVILSFASVQFFIGSRRLAIMPILAYGWLWHKTIRPLPRTLLIAFGAVLLFIVFPVISLYRQAAGSIRINDPSLLIQTFLSIDNPIVAIISEMAITLFTIGWTLELVPFIRPFALGSSYLYALFSIVPNFFWQVHPTAANELSKWLSWKVSPSYAASGGGWGYSFIAEAYLNFGWIGMPIALIIIGYVFARFVLWASRSGDLAKMAMLASFSSFFLLYARGEAASLPRYFLWYSLLPYALVILIGRVRVIWSPKKI